MKMKLKINNENNNLSNLMKINHNIYKINSKALHQKKKLKAFNNG